MNERVCQYSILPMPTFTGPKPGCKGTQRLACTQPLLAPLASWGPAALFRLVIASWPARPICSKAHKQHVLSLLASGFCSSLLGLPSLTLVLFTRSLKTDHKTLLL